MLKTITLLLGVGFFSQVWAYTDNDDYVAYSEIPYFTTSDSEAALSLLGTESTVKIDNNIADIVIRQKFHNSGEKALDGGYTFPASTRAAVYALTIKIEDRKIEAVVQEKHQAKETYEQAKSEGKSAGLLEQNKPNLFTMNVANILPGEIIEVELRYTEFLNISNNIYEFIVPSIDTNHRLNMVINSGTPISNIISPSHEIFVVRPTTNTAEIKLEEVTESAPRDFVLRYTPTTDEIERGLLLQQTEGENFFSLQLQPPLRVSEDLGINREYLFVIDTSGSMAGFPLEISKTLITELLERLNPWEKFNIVFFAGHSQLLAPSFVAATEENIRRAQAMMTNLQGFGGTHLIGALEEAATLPIEEGYTRSIITVTDGYVSVDAETYTFINENLLDANHFSFGIGERVNRHIIELIARAGFGQHFVSLDKKEAQQQGQALLSMIRYPLLTNIEVQFDGFDVYDVQPIYTPDLFASRPISITGKWRGSPKGQIHIRGNQGNQTWSTTIPLIGAKFTESRSLEFIWARQEIEQLQDLYYLDSNTKLEHEIIQLGLAFNLLTQFTSFVAVDSLARTHRSDEQPPISMGFALPQLAFNLTSLAALFEPKHDAKLLIIGEFELELIEGEWVDKNHSADLKTLSISTHGLLFQQLISEFKWIAELNRDQTYYFNFGDISICFSPNRDRSNTTSKDQIQKVLRDHENQK